MLNRFIALNIALGMIFYLAKPSLVFAQGIFPGGGGSFPVGQNFTVTVNASGATFTALEGIITVTGPVSIISFVPGAATWLPGMSPANGKKFAGAVTQTSLLRVATITLRGTAIGSGRVTVSSVQLARSGTVVGTSGGSTSFTITRAPTPPGLVEVSSLTHPNQEESYEATTAELSWKSPPNGADGYSTILDQNGETLPSEKVTTSETAVKYENLVVGTYYFHIRAHNTDGWGPTTHFRINIKPAVDETLPKPVIASIETTVDYSNDIKAGTLTGLIIKGTGPAGFKINLTFTPELGLPKFIEKETSASTEGEASPEAQTTLTSVEPVEKYPPPIADDSGNWDLTITDPVRAGFYKLVAQAQKEGVVSSPSDAIKFEISVADGGKVKIITSADETAAYKQAQVAAAKAKQRFFFSGIGAVALIILVAIAVTLWRRKLLPATDKLR